VFESDSAGNPVDPSKKQEVGVVTFHYQWQRSILASYDHSNNMYLSADILSKQINVLGLHDATAQTKHVSDLVNSTSADTIEGFTTASTKVSDTCAKFVSGLQDIGFNLLDAKAILFIYYRQSPLAKAGGKLSDGSNGECMIDSEIAALVSWGMPKVQKPGGQTAGNSQVTTPAPPGNTPHG
jgi:hypothetical protein